jgi:hypothetical protein
LLLEPETAEHIAEFARELGDQNWVDMNETEATHWRTAITNTTNLIG